MAMIFIQNSRNYYNRYKNGCIEICVVYNNKNKLKGDGKKDCKYNDDQRIKYSPT